MAATDEFVKRFWQRMGETYGSRWAETYGMMPTQAWRELLARFSPQAAQAAMGDLQSQAHLRQHPPTLPQFESLLIAALRSGRQEATAADFRRGYWRSRVIHGVSDAMGWRLTGEIGQSFEGLLIANRDGLGRACRDLLDQLDDLELKSGQRTQGQEDHCHAACQRIASAYAHLRPKPPTTSADGVVSRVGKPERETEAPQSTGAPF